MTKLLQTAIAYLLKRLAEKTTWTGVIALLVAQFGCQLTGVQVDALSQLAVQIVATLLILLPGDIMQRVVRRIGQ